MEEDDEGMAFDDLLQKAKSDGLSDEELKIYADLGPKAHSALLHFLNERRLRKGTYYTTIDDFLECESQVAPTIGKAAYKDLCRPYFQKGGKETVCRTSGTTTSKSKTYDPYEKTLRSLEDHPDLSAATADGQSRRSLDTDARASIWPCSVTRQTLSGEIAHLVPASKEHADTYFFVADFLFGYEEQRDEKSLWRLIHGSRSKPPKNRSRLKQKRKRDANETEESVGSTRKVIGSRVYYTGVKHMTSNMLRLAGQKDYWDKWPCVLLLPICEVDFAKNWTGEGYDAIMLIDQWPEPQDVDVSNSPRTMDLQDVAAQVNFLDAGEVEDDEENLQKAIELLRLFCSGILYALQKRKPESSSFECLTAGLALPRMKTKESRRVRRIKFSGQSETSGHPAPDPILLVCKSAVVWARRKGWKLAAAAEPEDLEDDISWDTLHAISARRFLEQRECAADTQNVIGLEVSF